MQRATVRGVEINYEVLGERGPWVALQPGGRRGLVGVKSLGEKIAEAGHRVLVYDRRNCGASGVSFDGGNSENEVWAEDLHELLLALDAAPAFVGGSSSGCRLALLAALRHPADLRGLLLWRVTGGAYAAQRLVQNYYTQFIEAAERGGMEAVCRSEHFAEVIASNPANRARLESMDAKHFISVMSEWRRSFNHGADHPVIARDDAGRDRQRAQLGGADADDRMLCSPIEAPPPLAHTVIKCIHPLTPIVPGSPDYLR